MTTTAMMATILPRPLACGSLVLVSGRGLAHAERLEARRSTSPERRDRLGDNALGVEPGGGVHALGLVVILKFVRQRHRAHLKPALERARFGEQGQHMRAETAGRAFLDGDEELVRRGQLENELAIEGLGEARVGDRGRQARAPRVRPPPSRLRQAARQATGSQSASLRAPPGPCRSATARPAPAGRRRRPRRADSATRSGRNRGRLRSRPCERVRPRPPPPLPSCSAGRQDRRCRKRRRASGRPRRPVQRGRGRSGPADSGSPRHARAGRSRAAGRSNRWRRTAYSLPSPSRRRT